MSELQLSSIFPGSSFRVLSGNLGHIIRKSKKQKGEERTPFIDNFPFTARTLIITLRKDALKVEVTCRLLLPFLYYSSQLF